MNAILVSKDLMFTSRVNALAKQIGVQLKVTSNGEKLQAALREESVSLVAVDLEIRGASPEEWLNWIDEACEVAPRKIAYAPHGQVHRIQEAREAGFDQVLTRGQFDAKIGEILESLSG